MTHYSFNKEFKIYKVLKVHAFALKTCWNSSVNSQKFLLVPDTSSNGRHVCAIGLLWKSCIFIKLTESLNILQTVFVPKTKRFLVKTNFNKNTLSNPVVYLCKYFKHFLRVTFRICFKQCWDLLWCGFRISVIFLPCLKLLKFIASFQQIHMPFPDAHHYIWLLH